MIRLSGSQPALSALAPSRSRTVEKHICGTRSSPFSSSGSVRTGRSRQIRSSTTPPGRNTRRTSISAGRGAGLTRWCGRSGPPSDGSNVASCGGCQTWMLPWQGGGRSRRLKGRGQRHRPITRLTSNASRSIRSSSSPMSWCRRAASRHHPSGWCPKTRSRLATGSMAVT